MKIRTLRLALQLAFLTLLIAAFRGRLTGPGGELTVHLLNGSSLLASVSHLAWMNWSPWLWVTVGILGLTLVAGRLYCSFYCPIGLFQDLATRLAAALGRSPTARAGSSDGRHSAKLRIFFFFLGFGLIFLHSPLIQYLDHYALLGKIAFLSTSGLLFLALLFGIALKTPRWFCTAVCPAGTSFSFLHILSAFQLRKPSRAQSPECGACKVCTRKCPTDCVLPDGSIDRGRCIQCLECLEFCPRGLFELKPAWIRSKISEPQDKRRAEFFKCAAAGAIGVLLARPLAARTRSWLTPPHDGRVLPPGAGSWELFHSRCVGCGMCVSACPSRVLTFRGNTPTLDFEKSFCGYECTRCTEACPNGALTAYPLATKKRIRLGVAHIDEHLCVAYRHNQSCGACAEHCPTGAITGRQATPTLLQPVMEKSRCIGCGACQHICPVEEPRHAVMVTAVAVQSFAAEPGVTGTVRGGPKSANPATRPPEQKLEDFKF